MTPQTPDTVPVRVQRAYRKRLPVAEVAPRLLGKKEQIALQERNRSGLKVRNADCYRVC